MVYAEWKDFRILLADLYLQPSRALDYLESSLVCVCQILKLLGGMENCILELLESQV